MFRARRHSSSDVDCTVGLTRSLPFQRLSSFSSIVQKAKKLILIYMYYNIYYIHVCFICDIDR